MFADRVRILLFFTLVTTLPGSTENSSFKFATFIERKINSILFTDRVNEIWIRLGRFAFAVDPTEFSRRSTFVSNLSRHCHVTIYRNRSNRCLTANYFLFFTIDGVGRMEIDRLFGYHY